MESGMVFVSYDDDNLKIAMQAVEYLERQGKKCWIYPRDVKRMESWADEVEEAIGGCGCFVLIYGKGAENSVRIPKEVGLASSAGKKVVQFRIENAEPTGALRYHLIDSVLIRAVRDAEKRFKQLAKAVTELSSEAEELQREQERSSAEQQPGSSDVLEESDGNADKRRTTRTVNGRRICIAAMAVLLAAAGLCLFLVCHSDSAVSQAGEMTVFFFHRTVSTDEVSEAEEAAEQDKLLERLDACYGKGGYRKETKDHITAVTVSAEKAGAEALSVRETLQGLCGDYYSFVNTVPAVWHSAKGDPFCGKYQCDIKEMKGQLFDAVFTFYGDDVSAGVWHDMNVMLRSRLDVLELPYAIGALAGQEKSVVVRIGMETLGVDMLGLLALRPGDVTVRDAQGFYEVETFAYDAREDGTLYATVELERDVISSVSGKIVHEFSIVSMENGSYVNLLSGTGSGRTVCLDASPFDADGKIPAQAEPLLKLIKAVSMEKKETTSFSVDFRIDDSMVVMSSVSDFQQYMDGKRKFGLQFRQYMEEGEKLEARLKKDLERDIAVRVGNDRTCYIDDYLEKDEDFPRQVVDQIKLLIDAVSTAQFDRLVIYFTGEPGEERARALYYDVKSDGFQGIDGALRLYFKGEDVERYADEIEELAGMESFFEERRIVPYEEYRQKVRDRENEEMKKLVDMFGG